MVYRKKSWDYYFSLYDWINYTTVESVLKLVSTFRIACSSHRQVTETKMITWNWWPPPQQCYVALLPVHHYRSYWCHRSIPPEPSLRNPNCNPMFSKAIIAFQSLLTLCGLQRLWWWHFLTSVNICKVSSFSRRCVTSSFTEPPWATRVMHCRERQIVISNLVINQACMHRIKIESEQNISITFKWKPVIVR